MITLTPYTEEMKSPLISWIADFTVFHAALLRGESEITEKEYIEAEKNTAHMASACARSVWHSAQANSGRIFAYWLSRRNGGMD